MHKGLWQKNQSETHCCEDPDISGTIIFKLILGKWDRVVWTGLIWLRTGTSRGLL
jgi:hypothetical protein